MPNIIRFGGSGNWTPSIFGDGRDGDAVISGTVSLPVTVPHRSIVEKQYKSLTINAGAVLKCADYNAGLILRVRGDCIIHGTIDQSGKAPKTNPQNNYPYPAQLRCGDGGDGGSTGTYTSVYYAAGGTKMLARTYGGGYGGGGAGGAYTDNYDMTHDGFGGIGGDGSIDINESSGPFIGGRGGDPGRGDYEDGEPGLFGGGGGGGAYSSNNTQYDLAYGGYGGSGGGSLGTNGGGGNQSTNMGAAGGGGGAGNYGGGIFLLYVGGNLIIDGKILCNGGQGGIGGKSSYTSANDGGGGGGGGGGGIYICHKGNYENLGILQANGGSGGDGGKNAGKSGESGFSGSIGSITVVQYTKDMEA